MESVDVRDELARAVVQLPPRMRAVVAVGVFLPQVLGSPTDRGATPSTHTLQLPAPADPAWQQVSTWPARGSLASDKTFMAAAAARYDGESARVVFAGDVEDTRLVVAFQRVPVPAADGTEGHAVTEQIRVLSGPRGAAVEAADSGAVIPRIAGAASLSGPGWPRPRRPRRRPRGRGTRPAGSA